VTYDARAAVTSCGQWRPAIDVRLKSPDERSKFDPCSRLV